MPKEIAGKTYYSVPEAAEMLGVTRMTAYRWAVSGRFQDVLQDKTSNHYYIAEASIRALIGSRFEPLGSDTHDPQSRHPEQAVQQAQRPCREDELLSKSLAHPPVSPAMAQRPQSDVYRSGVP